MTAPDVVICGGGIIGLATALELAKQGLRITVVEKEAAVGLHQSGHNSGVLHTGLYYAPGSLKAVTCSEGRHKMLAFCEEQGIPHRISGKLVVATSEDELPGLQELARRARHNGVRVEQVARRGILALEPKVRGVSALLVPDAGVVDFQRVTQALSERVQALGGQVVCSAEVVALTSRPRGLRVTTARGDFVTAHFVNCAGLHSDRVLGLSRPDGEPRQIQIVPFRGEYYELLPPASDLVQGLVYPVPDPTLPFLGVHFTRGLTDRVSCGPSAVLNPGRESYARFAVNCTDLTETLSFPGFARLAKKHFRTGLREAHRFVSKAEFTRSAQRLVPTLEAKHLKRIPAGIRAQALCRDGSLVDDFWFEDGPQMTHVVNAPSPGATASLAIGDRVATRVRAALERG